MNRHQLPLRDKSGCPTEQLSVVNCILFGAMHRQPVSLAYFSGTDLLTFLLITQEVRRCWRICLHCPVYHDIGIGRVVRWAIRWPPCWKRQAAIAHSPSPTPPSKLDRDCLSSKFKLLQASDRILDCEVQ